MVSTRIGRVDPTLAADAVVMRDDVVTIPAVVSLTRRARRLVTASLAIAAMFPVRWDRLAAGH